MVLAIFAVCERVRLDMGAVSVVLCTLGGARSMEGKRYHVRRALGSSGLAVGICGIGMSGGVGMTTLGGNAGGWSSQGRRIGRRIERGWARVFKGGQQAIHLHIQIRLLPFA